MPPSRPESYREFAPPPPLRGVLACVWTQSGGAGAKRVLPDACVDLIWRPGLGAFVAGPDTGPTFAADARYVGVRFRPGAGGLGVPFGELRDARVPLESVTGTVVPADAPPAAALRALLSVVDSRATGSRTVDATVGRAVRLLGAPGVRVAELPEVLGVSERHLRRRFHADVGYGPKTLHRVLRFQRAMALLRDGTALAEAAALAGYADHAHLSRDSARLAGLPPSELR